MIWIIKHMKLTKVLLVDESTLKQILINFLAKAEYRLISRVNLSVALECKA
jgi:hypothetical protein